MFCLFIDYLFNAQPFVLRHYIPINLISIAYLGVNLTYVKVTGKLIYSTIDWDSLAGYLTPILALFGTFLIFVIVERLNRIKLRSQGYHSFVDIIEGKK